MGRGKRSISDGVRAVILVLVIAILLIAGNDTWLALVAGLAPLAFSDRQGSSDQTTADELDAFRERLHEIQSDAWRRRRPGRRVSPNDWWGLADVPRPQITTEMSDEGGRPVTADDEGRLRKTIRRIRREATGSPDPLAKQRELPPEEAPGLLRALVGAEYNLVLQGPRDAGKTGTLFGFVLAAQQLRDADESFPLPLRVSLAGWVEYGLDESGAPRPDASLIGWIKKRFRDDYPGLLEHGAPADALLDALWREDIRAGGNTLILFIDDLDQVPPTQLPNLLNELSNRTVMITCRDTTRPVEQGTAGGHHPYDVEHWPGRWESLNLVQPTEAYAREFLGISAAIPLPVTIYRSPRLLMTLRSAFPEPARLIEVLEELSRLHTPEGAVDWIWEHLIAEGWPDPDAAEPAGDPRAVRTLAWVAQVGLFRNTRFAWWEVPRLAADRGRALGGQEPLVTAAYRSVRRRRADSATAWAALTFVLCVVIVVVLLSFGRVQGYDRASHGLQAAGRLTPADLRSWDWTGARAVITNPVYQSGWVLLVVVLTIFGLARFGDEFEHKRGGRPQIIEPRIPGGRGLREIATLIPVPSAVLVITGLTLAGLFQLVGSGPAGQLWVGTAFAALFVGLLAWLHWCSREGDNLTPADTFASDQKSARVVAITLGLAALISSTTLSWWFTSPRHTPTLGQCLWISAAAAISIGMARGFYLGAGMIAPLLFRLRPGFGVGYAHRMLMLEESLRRLDEHRPDGRDAAAPLAVTSVFINLDRSAHWEEDRARGLVLRQIGSLIRLRDVTLERYLGRMPRESAREQPVSKSRTGLRTGLQRVTIVVATTVALLSLTGTAAVVVPRSFCSPQQDLLAFLHRVRSAQTWLENGQCVGFETLTGSGNQFTATIATSGAPEAERNAILARIQRQNAAVPDPKRAVNMLFLAPLSRTAGSSAINALYQLQGAQLAQAAINQSDTTYVRLVVANVGEDFTSGPSVVQVINRKFPSDPADPESIKAVIGVAQSRAAARESLAQLREVPVVAGAVNGNDMRHGLILGQDVDFGADFVSVAPSDHEVARALLSAPVLAKAEATLHRAAGRATTVDLGIIRDSTDTYFSNDLGNSLDEVAEESLQGQIGVRERVDLRETAPAAHYRSLAADMCSSRYSRTVWLFAGRGTQLTRLDQALRQQDGRQRCRPAVIAGPGALSAIQSGSVTASGPLQNLLFYSLVNRSWSMSAAELTPTEAISRASDLSTGWAATVEAYRRLVPDGAARCPDAPNGPQIPVSIENGAAGDGHNTLYGTPDPCSSGPAPAIYLCPLNDTSGQVLPPCVAVGPEDLRD